MNKIESSGQGSVSRKTKETDIQLDLALYGSGRAEIETGVPFLDHMLTLFTVHGFFDLKIVAVGDTEVDDHHTVEDIGICLGQAISKALGCPKSWLGTKACETVRYPCP